MFCVRVKSVYTYGRLHLSSTLRHPEHAYSPGRGTYPSRRARLLHPEHAYSPGLGLTVERTYHQNVG